MPSFILIHPIVWPQYTNVTDRQDRQDRQWSDKIGRTVLQTVAQKLLDLFVEGLMPAVLLCVTGKQRMWRMMSTPAEHESATTIDVYTGCASLGVSVVGGIDTPLVTTAGFAQRALYNTIPLLIQRVLEI